MESVRCVEGDARLCCARQVIFSHFLKTLAISLAGLAFVSLGVLGFLIEWATAECECIFLLFGILLCLTENYFLLENPPFGSLYLSSFICQYCNKAFRLDNTSFLWYYRYNTLAKLVHRPGLSRTSFLNR